MTLTGTQKALTTARLGAARLGATRLGYIPEHTRSTTTGSTSGPLTRWTKKYPPTTAWTKVNP